MFTPTSSQILSFLIPHQFERLFLISWENNRDCHITMPLSLKTVEVQIKGDQENKRFRTVQVYCFFVVFYVTRYSVFYFLLDLFPQASCHCIRRGIVSTHFFVRFLRVVLFSGFSYLARQLLLPRTRNSIWQVYH